MTEPFSAEKPSLKTVPADKFILDATAGFRMMWFNKHHRNCIYLDQRPECEPDIVGDFRDLKQFTDNSLRLIIFDPPHLIEGWNKGPAEAHYKSFGSLRAETWQSDLKRGFKELWRILVPFGILIFKWNDHDHSVKTALKIPRSLGLEPLFSQQTKNGTRSSTFWFCFMKIPDSMEASLHK